MKKLIPALVLLLVSAMVLSTSSYAWFSMNKTVSATGMSLTSTAPANLLITNKAAAAWAATTTISETFGSAKLFPASTSDGLKFFALQGAQEIGTDNLGGILAGSGENILFYDSVTNSDIVKSVALDTNGYWVDYTLNFKTSGDSSSTTLKVFLKEIIVAEGGDVLNNCIRVAIIEDTPTGNVVGIYAVDELEDVKSITSLTESKANLIATDVKKAFEDDEFSFEVKTDGTIKTIIVRVWIEGQHSDCINENAEDAFAISLVFSSVPKEA